MGFAQTDAGMSGAIQNCKIFLAAPTGATPEQPAQKSPSAAKHTMSKASSRIATRKTFCQQCLW
jgi:hypothetical protein